MGGANSVEAATTTSPITSSPPSNTGDASNPANPPPKCKACCACPETKRVRDQCIVEKGQENCTELIEKHKECMRSMGFNI